MSVGWSANSCVRVSADALLGVMSGEDAGVSGEALLYCVGALKFLSGNDALLRILLAKGCVGVAQQLLQKLHPLSEPGHALFATAGHILVQVRDGTRGVRSRDVASAVEKLCFIVNTFWGFVYKMSLVQWMGGELLVVTEASEFAQVICLRTETQSQNGRESEDHVKYSIESPVTLPHILFSKK